jgi:cytochrome c553
MQDAKWRAALARAAVLATATLMAAATTVAHADPKAGRQKAQMCVACHGPLGLAKMANTPNLAGQPEVYLSEQLKAFRGGVRKNEIMSLIARPLTDTEIGDLAEWYASLQVEVAEPR